MSSMSTSAILDAPGSGKAIAKPQIHTRKPRIPRRRPRARNDMESDDELEREAISDSDSEADHSSIDSESDSESDVHSRPRSEVVTPSTTQSPPPRELDLGADIALKPPVNGDSGPFVASTDWAEMVADETANGTGDLPVIDFADLGQHPIHQRVPSPPPRPRKSHKAEKKRERVTTLMPAPAPVSAPTPAPESHTNDENDVLQEPEASTSGHSPTEPLASRSRGQSAREAYQQRLETDPSYVPKVGEFWGHDDRLLDKDLRSLSGWWRGRWQNRGRGRGGFGMRGMRGGRGGLNGGPPHLPTTEKEEEGGPPENQEEVPPIDRPWTHDGFEEMKQRDDRRRTQQHQQQQPFFGPQRGFGFRGRGGFIGSPGRGGFVRGGAYPYSGYRQGSPFIANPGRPWFAMKPEKVWTKQHDAFLYFDSALRPRPGQGPGIRIKLPGGRGQVVRGPARHFNATLSMSSPQVAAVAVSTISSQDTGDKLLFTVRLPCRAGKEKATEADPKVTHIVFGETTAATAELSIEEVFTVRPHAVPNRRVSIDSPLRKAPDPLPSAASPHLVPKSIPVPAFTRPLTPVLRESPPHQMSALPDARTQERLALEPPIESRDTPPSVQIQETVLRHPPSSVEPLAPQPITPVQEPRPGPPVLHPLQTSFSPIPAVSPPYASPYAYGPVLPPGLAMGPHGVTYEVATGRPVYLQHTPPPMFTPRPVLHGHMVHPSASMPFVPTHMHHHSTASPDFIAQSHTPPVHSVVDPATGVPIFTPARQSSRIEIRAPTDSSEGKSSRPTVPRPSGLRSTVLGYSQEQRPMYYGDASEQSSNGAVAGNHGAESSQVQAQALSMESVAMLYPQYQQPYYYSEPYGYTQYIDPTPQVVPYDMYPQDHHAQPLIYY